MGQTQKEECPTGEGDPEGEDPPVAITSDPYIIEFAQEHVEQDREFLFFQIDNDSFKEYVVSRSSLQLCLGQDMQ